MYKKANKEAIIQEEFKAYSVVWECEKGHKNFQTIIGKEGTQHDICLKCGEHYEYVVANGVEQSSSNCNIPIVSGSVLTDVDYWKIRCKLSEAIEAASPCDPDITTKQINAYSDYNKFIERYGTDR